MDPLNSFLHRKTLQFLTIYETANIHRAAKVLGLTQPALTMSLKQLETEIGAPLFKRSVKGLSPTSTGKIYYRYANMLRQSGLYAATEIMEQTSGNGGTLRIGAGVGWASTIIPSTLTRLNRRFPKLTIELIAGVVDQLAAMFELGKIDVLLAAGPAEPLNTAQSRCVFLTNIPMVAIADASSVLAKKDVVTIEELGQTKWAGFYEDESFIHHANHFMNRQGQPPPNIIMRTNSVATLTEFVKGTGAITIVATPLATRAASKGLVQLNLSQPLWEIPVNLYFLEVATDFKPLQSFVSIVRKQFKNLT